MAIAIPQSGDGLTFRSNARSPQRLVEIYERDRRGDRREVNGRVPRPEVERER